jgi:hypothetical protein
MVTGFAGGVAGTGGLSCPSNVSGAIDIIARRKQFR